jgi:hypothetical protein
MGSLSAKNASVKFSRLGTFKYLVHVRNVLCYLVCGRAAIDEVAIAFHKLFESVPRTVDFMLKFV